MDSRTVDRHFISCNPVYVCADSANRFQQYINILNIRQILKNNRLIRHNSCCQNAKRRILRTADLHFTD